MANNSSDNPRLAVALMLIATAFIAATMLLAKMLADVRTGPALHPLQITHGRFLFAFAAIGTFALVTRRRVSRPAWGLHVARTTFGWAGVSLMFAAVAFIPLADATAITFLNPVFGMMLAIPLLGEKVGRIRWSAALMALAGAMILLRPTPDTFQVASLLALGAAVLLGMEIIFIKKLSGREPPFQILLINNCLGLVLATAAVIPVWQAPTGTQWILLAALGLAMASAQACYVNAMARADASFVAPFSYGTLIFAALYDVLFYNQVPDAVTLLGAGIILCAGVVLAVRDAQHRRRPAG